MDFYPSGVTNGLATMSAFAMPGAELVCKGSLGLDSLSYGGKTEGSSQAARHLITKRDGGAQKLHLGGWE